MDSRETKELEGGAGMAMGEVRWVDWGSNSFIPSLWLCGSTLEFWFRRKTLQRSLGWGGSVD